MCLGFHTVLLQCGSFNINYFTVRTILCMNVVLMFSFIHMILKWLVHVHFKILGSFISCDDSDGNKSSKKSDRIYQQNNNFAQASCFFVHFLRNYDVQMPNFTFSAHQTTAFFFFS